MKKNHKNTASICGDRHQSGTLRQAIFFATICAMLLCTLLAPGTASGGHVWYVAAHNSNFFGCAIISDNRGTTCDDCCYPLHLMQQGVCSCDSQSAPPISVSPYGEVLEEAEFLLSQLVRARESGGISTQLLKDAQLNSFRFLESVVSYTPEQALSIIELNNRIHAYVVSPVDAGIIFSDGFESGDLSSWQDVVLGAELSQSAEGTRLAGADSTAVDPNAQPSFSSELAKARSASADR